MSHLRVHRPLLTRGLVACLLSLGFVVSACGDSDQVTASEETTVEPSSSPSPSETPIETDAPATTEPQCDDVWIDGEPLPDPYRGCYAGDSFVEAESQRCAFGSKLFTFEDTFYAAQFNKINETAGLSGDKAYQKALASCSG